MRLAAAFGLLCVVGAAQAQPVPDPGREQKEPEPLTPPRVLEETPPQYPAGASGVARVVLQIDVDERGVPGNLVVLTAPQPIFDEAALAAAQKLRFEPARRGDVPVAVRIQYAF